MIQLMRGFPPDPGTQVTLANWRTAPFNQWAFHHVREIVPSADIPNDPARVAALPAAHDDGLGRVPVPVDGLSPDSDLVCALGERPSVDTALGATDTDGLVVVRRGRVVFERYANGMTAQSPHILMSVSKSLLGLVAGLLEARGDLDPERLISDVVPEVAATAYAGATIRHLLDMRAGIAFDEDYLATSGPIVQYRKATNWNPPDPHEPPADLRGFYRSLTATSGVHGGPLHYVSPNTDLLGWVIERATSRRYADLVSELLWRPMGAQQSAYITVDRLGAPRCAGGICATVRDLARVGRLIADGGTRDGARVVPVRWIDEVERAGDPAAWTAGDLAEYFPGTPMRYRSQWYAEDGAAPLLFGFGIHGQYLFIDRARSLVIAKASSQALPIDRVRMALTRRMVDAISRALG